MKRNETTWRDVASAQHGAIDHTQLTSCGLSSRQIGILRQRGDLTKLFRGVYGVGGIPQTREQRAMAACLATTGLASHRCAAWLWGLRGCDGDTIELLPDPVRQHSIGSVRIDLAYPAKRVAIEAQSVAWHTGRADLQRDCEKLNLLIGMGWRLLVFTWHDARSRSGYVVDVVARALSGVEATENVG